MSSSIEKHAQKYQCERNWAHLFKASDGIFYGDISFIRILPFTMFRVTLFFVIFHALRRILKPLKQPEFVIKTLTGIILGPIVLGRYRKYGEITDIPSQIHFMNFFGFLGLIYYVFIIAVKTDSGVILRFRKKYWVMGLSSLLIPFVVMTILVATLRPFHANVNLKTYYFVMQISSTWFTNMSPLLVELNLLTTDFGQLALSLSLTNEFMMWGFTMSLILTISFRRGFGSSILPLSVMLSVIIFVVRPTMSWMAKQMPRGQPIKEIYIVGTLMGGALSSCFSDVLIGSPVMGIIFFGLAVPNGPPLGSAIVERSETFIKTCLLPLFFLAVGDSIDLTIVDLRSQSIYMFIIIIGYLTKALTITLISMLYNMSGRRGFALGLIMNTSGVMHLVVYWNQWMHETLDNHISSQLIISSMLVTSIVTPLALHFNRNSKNGIEAIRGFQLSVQSSLSNPKMQILICIDSEEDVPGIITLLKASNPTQTHPISVYLVHLTELAGQAAPTLTPHKKHQRLCKYNGCTHILSAMKSYCDDSQGGVIMQLLTIIAPLATIYEGICKVAEERMVPLVIVPFIYRTQSHLGKTASSQLNIKLLQQIPCTLGVYVNRDTLRNKSSYHHIAVIFCGGEDDREALAYATRMSTHPGVTITMLRIFIKEYHNENSENELDGYVIDKFKTKNISNTSAIYKEIHVEDWLETLKVLRTLDNNYELVIVGRRHVNQLEEDDMYVFSDNPELGEIGELIVSTTPQWDNTSILVMQHCMTFERETQGFVVLEGI